MDPTIPCTPIELDDPIMVEAREHVQKCGKSVPALLTVKRDGKLLTKVSIYGGKEDFLKIIYYFRQTLASNEMIFGFDSRITIKNSPEEIAAYTPGTLNETNSTDAITVYHALPNEIRSQTQPYEWTGKSLSWSDQVFFDPAKGGSSITGDIPQTLKRIMDTPVQKEFLEGLREHGDDAVAFILRQLQSTFGSRIRVIE